MKTYTRQFWEFCCPLFFRAGLWLLLSILPGRNTLLKAQTGGAYWNKNVAILQMRIRSISPRSYVREIVIADFNKSELLPVLFGFGPDLFNDDGNGLDSYSNDGIYTSVNVYLHNTDFPFISIDHIRHAYFKVIIDDRFQYKEQLKKIAFRIQHVNTRTDSQWLIECSLKLCICPDACICQACEWGPAELCLDWRVYNTAISLNW